jgi:hypothetical protein
MKFLTSLKPDYKTMRFKAMIICALFCNSAILVIAQNKSDRYHEFGSVKGWQLNGYIGPLIALYLLQEVFLSIWEPPEGL